jgi:hypothetical protein
MNCLKLILVLVIFSSCKGTSQKNESSGKNDEAWEISNKTIQTHTYNKLGLLDTSFINEYSYSKGLKVNETKSLIIRKYDSRNNLVLDRTYSLKPNGQKKLVTEIISEFDKFNNLISEKVKSEGVDNGERHMKTYNERRQLIKRVDVFRKFNTYSEQTNFDTIAVHFEEDNKKLKFDTVITIFEYNTDGNCIKETTSGTKDEIQKTRVLIYAGKEKISGYDINNKNDTTSTFSYVKEGKLLLQILKDREFGGCDTSWYDEKKEIRFIHRDSKFKFKTEMKYNEKGDLIESITYN